MKTDSAEVMLNIRHVKLIIMVVLCNSADHYIFILFLLLLFFPRLISAVGDWMFTILQHIVWRTNLECRSEMCHTRLAANTERKKSPSRHHRTTLSGHIFATKECIDNLKLLVKQQCLLYMS